MRKRISVFMLIGLSLVGATRGLHAESLDGNTWPQWRGPHRDGQVADSVWPADLSTQHLTAQWSVPLEPSYSGPIVSVDRIFVTETKDKQFEVVRALDRKTGKLIWETEWKGALKVPFFAAANGSWIRATPAFDGDRLYVAGMKDVLVCLDVESGAILWRKDFVSETGSPVPQFGFASSPLLHGDHVLVQAGAGFVKLKKETGDIVWQTLKDGGGMSGGCVSSPVVATIEGVPQFVVQTRTQLAGVSLDDGKVLWSREIDAFRGMNILTPTVMGNAIFTSSYGGRSLLLKIAREESEWTVSQIWSHKSQGYMSSPVLIEGHFYLHLRNQRLVCLDAKSGTERWTTRPFGKYWSMVANGDRLLALDQTGELFLIQASPEEFTLIDRQQVADDTWAHVAVVGNEIFVRDLTSMKAFSWR